MIWQCSRDEGPEWQSGSHEVANGQLEFRGRTAPARVAAERVEDLVSLACRPLVSAILGTGGRIRKQSAITQPDQARIGC